MRLNELELFKEKTKAKKEKIYRKEITWKNKTFDCVNKY